MELSNEDKVTRILINREIIKKQEAPEVFEDTCYASNPCYDLSSYIKKHKDKPIQGRFGSRYLFVK